MDSNNNHYVKPCVDVKPCVNVKKVTYNFKPTKSKYCSKNNKFKQIKIYERWTNDM
jgi:hypothetical protein